MTDASIKYYTRDVPDCGYYHTVLAFEVVYNRLIYSIYPCGMLIKPRQIGIFILPEPQNFHIDWFRSSHNVEKVLVGCGRILICG